MKKVLLFTLMGLVMLGCFTSCKKEKQEKEFKEKIIGKWKSYSADGALRLTDEKVINDYLKDGIVKGTCLRDGTWICSEDHKYKIEGDKYTFTNIEGIYSHAVNITATIVSITDSYFTLKDYMNSVTSNYQEYIMERVTVDYSQPIIGLWEGVSMTGDETYGDVNHRWQFNADGTFVYFIKNAENQWEADPSNTGNIYYVDGNFYGSRWYKNEVEYREWWDIDYCNETEMRWSALRKKKDGSLFTTTMTMKRVVEN